MQIVMHISVRSNYIGSLRESIIDDLKKREYGLEVEYEKKQGRSSGWAKIKGNGLSGVINIAWLQNSHTLVARAIARNGNTPNELLGRFLSYLLDRKSKKIRAISILPE